MDCQRNIALMLEVHPALVKIEYTGTSPFASGTDAYICGSDIQDFAEKKQKPFDKLEANLMVKP